ncbi:MAG: tyrosine-protein kinase Etk/Wzc, partial [Flavobacteriaceae bacterium]
MQNLNDTTGYNPQEASDTLNIKEELEKYLFHWKWFLLCLLISLLGAFLFIRYSSPLYSASTTIMIKDNQKSGISKELAAFEDLGIVGGSANNTDNEIEILKSRKIVGSVVDSLNLTTLYFTEGRIKSSELYTRSPIKIIFDNEYEEVTKQRKDTSFAVYITSVSKFELKDMEGNFIAIHSFDEKLDSKLGSFKVQKTTNFDLKGTRIIHVSSLDRNKVIIGYLEGLTVGAVDKLSSVLKLFFTHPVKQKAEDFLNELVKQYNIDAIKDKNEVSQKTKVFIDERISSIGNDLNTIQDRVKKFKTDNEITGLSAEGELALEAASFNNEKLIQIKTQLNIAEAVLKNIDQQENKDETLPQNLGFSEVSIIASIKAYNELVVYKNRLGTTAGAKNPQIVQYQIEINALKLNLRNSISNLIATLKLQYAQINKEADRVNSKISAIPFLERGFIDIARQQEIIAGLYSYLLKKKEETAISLAVTVPNAKIIDVAYGSNIPVAPKKKIIYLAALLLGVLIPFIIVYLKNLLDTKVHSRKDIEDLTTIPFIGDIPHSDSDSKIVIGNDSRTSVAEAFRLIRTNLDFMLPNKADASGKTIFITSTTSGE